MQLMPQNRTIGADCLSLTVDELRVIRMALRAMLIKGHFNETYATVAQTVLNQFNQLNLATDFDGQMVEAQPIV